MSLRSRACRLGSAAIVGLLLAAWIGVGPRSIRAAPQASVGSGQQAGWDAALKALARIRPSLDTSGLAEVDAHTVFSPDSDLKDLCTARKQGIDSIRFETTDALRALGASHDELSDEQRAQIHRMQGALASFQGDTKAAVEYFTLGRDELAPYVSEYPDLRKPLLDLEEARGVMSMRQGEMDNCLMNPSADRCIFPIRPGGVHQNAIGAAGAVEQFKVSLATAPESLELRWLLNLALMVLGRYPADVPKEQLIPPAAFHSETSMPRFMDVAPAARLGRKDIAGGTITEDFDGDGLVDVMLSSVDLCAPLSLYRNRGDGTFEDRSEAAGLSGQLGGVNIVQADYDNDGRPDVFVMRGGWEKPMRNSLLRNNPDGTFTDVTREAGLWNAAHATHSAAWADFDNDGWVDLYVGHERSPSQLFRNRGDGTFEDVTQKAGVGATAFTKGVAWGDYDNDGFPDLYVSNFSEDNFLYHNNRDGTFSEVAARAGVRKPLLSFPTWFFDYDNDGRLDIFVASYPPSLEEFVKHYVGLPPEAETLTLYHNNGDGTFTDVSRRTGLDRVVPTMGANFGDLDNDGFLDMYLGTGMPSFAALMPNIMLKNDAGERFLDVTEATGTGHLQKGHGIAFADLDNDGNEDVVLNVGGAVPGDNYEDVLFHNPGGYENHWVSVRLIGVKTNRGAIGAKITVRLTGAGAGSQIRYREVTSGGSFGASSLTQHIGLGKAKVIDSLEIEWPTSRTRQVFHGVAADQFLDVRELDDHFTARSPRSFTLGRP